MCMVCLGIDPGVIACGFGIVAKKQGRMVLLDCGVLRMTSKQSLPDRVSQIHTLFESKITQWGVTNLSLETPFLGKNAQAFLKLGYVRGILYLLTHRFSLQLHEFSPCEVKRALTGSGAAEKEQLAWVVTRLFGVDSGGKLDMTDAIALALCGLWSMRIS